ncbi:MAG: phenylalanine--tRNA ligase subunit alpha [Streptosporangiaceae bacterium]
MAGQEPSDDLLQRLANAREQALTALRGARTTAALDVVRRDVVGRSGALPEIRRSIGSLRVDDRKRVGAALNQAMREVEAALRERERELLDSEPALGAPFDVTLPGLSIGGGGLHPTVQMMYDLNDAFTTLNFDVYEGPEISSEEFEFDRLNFPPEHPARETMDTFWLEGASGGTGSERLCLRPHLTGASVRYMLEHEPPLRFVYPGRAYRNETADARHERAFYQYEVLIVDRDVPLTAGKFLVDTILDTVFGRSVPTRMRTGFFPFVEPGFEIDMLCQVCGGKGCRTCRNVGWLELMPGGVPHPNVLRAGRLDPDVWTGFYVNVGLDRLVMMRYGIEDIRLMHSADLRFLGQFA